MQFRTAGVRGRVKPALAQYFHSYEKLHRNLTNRVLHHIGMFFMIWGIIAALDLVTIGTVDGYRLTLAIPLLCGVLGWYAMLNVRIAIAAAAWYVPCIPLGRMVSPLVIGAAVLFGATAQFVGHYAYEPMPLRLLKSIRYAMIAPIFFLALTMRLWSLDTTRNN